VPAPDSPDYPAGAVTAGSLPALADLLVECRACPRLVDWRESVAVEKRAAFRDQRYWARPVPGFGDAHARIAVVGLAPAAHGANRTGRMFTGDRSGDFLYAGLHRAGLASRPASVALGDGLELTGVRVTAPVRCAPPANRPTPAERRRCAPWLARELELLGPDLRVLVVLGGFGWQAALDVMAGLGWQLPQPRPRFGHGAEAELADAAGRAVTLLGCYHVSQQNTFTGKLTAAGFDAVLDAVNNHLGRTAARRTPAMARTRGTEA
jgi:uracil-DNA glycosylase family 4